MSSRPVRSGAGADRRERGFSLVEMALGMAILAIVMGACFELIVAADHLYAKGRFRANSETAAALAVTSVSQRLKQSVTPEYAAFATGSTVTTTGPCWGTTNTSAPAGSATLSLTLAALSSPDTTTFVWAHPFDAIFCSIQQSPTTLTAYVYRLWINPSTCSSTYCTLQLVTYGTRGTSAKSVLESWSGIWCTSTCQTDNQTNGYTVAAGGTPALFTYYRVTGNSSVAITQPIDAKRTTADRKYITAISPSARPSTRAHPRRAQ
jgi:prepilin-type N-terminal cleavage/methylation domain-containing protein